MLWTGYHQIFSLRGKILPTFFLLLLLPVSAANVQAKPPNGLVQRYSLAVLKCSGAGRLMACNGSSPFALSICQTTQRFVGLSRWTDRFVLTVTALFCTVLCLCVVVSCFFMCSSRTTEATVRSLLFSLIQWISVGAVLGVRMAQLVERRPQDPMDSMTRGSNPVRSNSKKKMLFFSESKMLC